MRDFSTTRYEHFLASAVAVEPSFRLAAQRGLWVVKSQRSFDEISIGEIIKGAVCRIKSWQKGGNTMLGTTFLLCPIAVAAGVTLAEGKKLSNSQLRKNLKQIVESTTSQDSVAAFNAIKMAEPGGLFGKAPKLDVYDPNSQRRIMEENITLYDIFRISAPYDSISKEWVENYRITFEIGLPYFAETLRKTRSLNMATTLTFLRILSAVPDTLISRKAGSAKAEEISQAAARILRKGLQKPTGRKQLANLDMKLRQNSNQYNPGTTADIIAAVLAITILKGYRP
jgi:triphosphoribosyl-dephospho-CoA synthase